MGQNSEGGNRWKENTARFFADLKDWLIQNKKISILVTVVIVAALLAGTVFLSRGKDTEGTDGEDAEASEFTVPEVPLEENAVAAVTELMNNYYAALAEGDVDTLKELTNYIGDSDSLRIRKKSEYIENYENIVCYTKAGLTEDSYLVYAYNEVKLYDFEASVPSLSTFVVYKNEAGDYYIYEGDVDDNTLNYYTELSEQDDVTNLVNTVKAKYNEVVAADSELEAFMEGFRDLIKEEVAEALAELEQENSDESDGEEAQAAEAESEQEQETSQEPKAKVTEVETTDTVNVRSSDSETADKVGKAEKGTRLPLIEKKGNGWSKIEFEGQEAYIKSEYLMDVVNVVDDGSQQAEGGAAEEQAGDTQQESSSGSTGLVGTDGKVTAKTTVNVRGSASENGERLGVIYQGDTLELIMQQADGWCKVKYNGKTGYVKTEFVE